MGLDVSLGWVRVDTEPLSLWVKLLVLQEEVLCLEEHVRSCGGAGEEPKVGSPPTNHAGASCEQCGECSLGGVGRARPGKGHTLSACCSLPKDPAERSPVHTKQPSAKETVVSPRNPAA